MLCTVNRQMQPNGQFVHPSLRVIVCFTFFYSNGGSFLFIHKIYSELFLPGSYIAVRSAVQTVYLVHRYQCKANVFSNGFPFPCFYKSKPHIKTSEQFFIGVDINTGIRAKKKPTQNSVNAENDPGLLVKGYRSYKHEVKANKTIRAFKCS